MATNISETGNSSEFFKNKAVSEMILKNTIYTDKNTKDMIGIINGNNHGPVFSASSFYSHSLSEKNKIAAKLSDESVSESKYVANLTDYISLLYINFHASYFINNIVNIAIDQNINIEVVEVCEGVRFYPDTDCGSVKYTYNTFELIQDYAPSKILLYPLDLEVTLFDHYIFGIYLLDRDDNIMCRQFFEVFHEEIAPEGCKKMRIPKTITEFSKSFDLVY